LPVPVNCARRGGLGCSGRWSLRLGGVPWPLLFLFPLLCSVLLRLPVVSLLCRSGPSALLLALLWLPASFGGVSVRPLGRSRVSWSVRPSLLGLRLLRSLAPGPVGVWCGCQSAGSRAVSGGSRCRLLRFGLAGRRCLRCSRRWPSGSLSRSSPSGGFFFARGCAVSVPSPVVGFSGSRRLASAFRPLVSGVVASVVSGGRSVAVGCAAGADAFVRAAAPAAAVFSVSAFGRGRGAFAARSVAFVRAVAAGGAGSGLVVFPSAPCPVGLVPSASASRCFSGLGSGSWASAALAAGLGLPVVVFPCGFSALPASWGSWVPAGSGVWAGGFRLVPLSLF
jgi:hypothetical protein